MTTPSDTVRDGDDLGERGSDGVGHVRRELVGHQSTHVVGLDEVCEVGHAEHPSGQESLRMRRCPRRPDSTAPDSASALAWPRGVVRGSAGRLVRGRPASRTASASASEVVGREGGLGELAAHAHDLPAAWGRHALGVLETEVIGVRLGVGRERAHARRRGRHTRRSGSRRRDAHIPSSSNHVSDPRSGTLAPPSPRGRITTPSEPEIREGVCRAVRRHEPCPSI